ncbi:MAG: cell division protein [Rhodospirillum sp.]|nr:cell division protein [Rhodospirillum sp.]MCF8491882.1 cell division protein [Rhodospirillum sp.]MCF8502270.1 cell division protein [Rhodospirillum sp.]
MSWLPHVDLPVAEDGNGRFLPMMIGIMVFLATLAMAGALAVENVVDSWNRDVTGTLTIQIMPAEGTPEESERVTSARLEQALGLLRAESSVADAQAIPVPRLRALMEPWLGSAELVADLPMPRLIDVTLREDKPIDLGDLAKRLADAVPGATLDDHRLWLSKLVGLAEGLGTLARVVVLLVTLATAVAVVQATRSGLATHRPAIEVLHLIGAQDDYIARQFATRAMLLGLAGGLLGLLLALPAILLVGWLSSDIEGGFVPKVTLTLAHWMLLLCLPLAASAVAMITTRVTVLRTLARML